MSAGKIKKAQHLNKQQIFLDPLSEDVSLLLIFKHYHINAVKARKNRQWRNPARRGLLLALRFRDHYCKCCYHPVLSFILQRHIWDCHDRQRKMHKLSVLQSIVRYRRILWCLLSISVYQTQTCTFTYVHVLTIRQQL